MKPEMVRVSGAVNYAGKYVLAQKKIRYMISYKELAV
jgi:hypothetical protein